MNSSDQIRQKDNTIYFQRQIFLEIETSTDGIYIFIYLAKLQVQSRGLPNINCGEIYLNGK